MSDNGASAEGGVNGSFNEQYFFNLVPESIEENLQRIDDLGTPRANNHYPWGWAWAGNTPLKRFKRDTHEGGVADPLIVHWPAGIGTDGETRHQYVHAIDVMPTLLDLIGIERARRHRRRRADADRRCELRADAARRRRAERARHPVLRDARLAGALPRRVEGGRVPHPPFINYDGSDTRRPFDDDVWELYHVADDFAEVHDLAADGPTSSTSCRSCGGRKPRSTRCCRSTTSRAGSATALPARSLRALRRDRAAARSDRAELAQPLLHDRRRARRPGRTAPSTA